MSRLITELKKKYGTPEAAIEALGLDASILKSAVVGDSKLNLSKDASLTEWSTNLQMTLRKVKALEQDARNKGVDKGKIDQALSKDLPKQKIEALQKLIEEKSVSGDSKKELNMSKVILTRKAAVAQGALMTFLQPKLAKDAKLDWGKILGRVTGKNFASKKGAIVAGIKEQTKGKLAKDASVDGLVELLDGLEKVEAMEHGDADALETDPNSGIPMKMEPEEEEETMDDDPGAKLGEYLKGQGMDDEAISGAMQAAGFGGHDAEMNDPEGVPDNHKPGSMKAANEGEDEVDEEDGGKFAKAKDKKAKDEPPPFKGKPEVGGGMSGDQINKAIQAAVKRANDEADKKITQARDEAKAVRTAERFVRPWVGDLAMAHDSAEEVYKTALTSLGVDVKGVHPSAFKTILERIPQPGTARQAQDTALAADAGTVADFHRRYPQVARIGRA
jgi:hypothetical protein